MKMISACFAVVFLGCGLIAAAEPEKTGTPPESLIKQMQGNWRMTAVVNDGELLAGGKRIDYRVTVEGKSLITKNQQGQELYRATFRLDANKKPVTMTTTTSMAKMPEMTSLGIMKFEDPDHWVLCYALPNQPQPDSFDAIDKNKAMIFRMSRIEKE
ncbi:MAG: TIGR03067 domain-containing protein [Planctomycetota bacterium]